MKGIGAWEPRHDGMVEPLFGTERKIVDLADLRRDGGRPVGRFRWWIGYKLYAVVYWLLRGHA